MTEEREKRARSGRTKQRILAAARRLFASEGYERTTIRAVAAAADIDPAMVMRYFGSKEGLFAEAATFDLALPALSSVPRRERGRRLARHYVDLWGRQSAGGGLAILLRAGATNDGAADRVREIFRTQVLPTIAAVVTDAAPTRAVLIASQLLGFAYCRYVVRIPALVSLDDEIIVSNLARSIQRCLDGPIGAD
ncbi:MAG TPA: TetR family transcriptional regulator [Kofleriaceae bacterium]|nr:TetR family transcriptional regulator [Kofleriaceae bacterium]